jgi:hypothetical protein
MAIGKRMLNVMVLRDTACSNDDTSSKLRSSTQAQEWSKLGKLKHVVQNQKACSLIRDIESQHSRGL